MDLMYLYKQLKFVHNSVVKKCTYAKFRMIIWVMIQLYLPGNYCKHSFSTETRKIDGRGRNADTGNQQVH